MHELFRCNSEESFLKEIDKVIDPISPLQNIQLWVKDIPLPNYKLINNPSHPAIILSDEYCSKLIDNTMIWKNGSQGTADDVFCTESNCLIAGLYVNQENLLGWLVVTFLDIEQAKQKQNEILEIIKIAGFAYERLILFSMMHLLSHQPKEKQLARDEDLLTAISGYVSQLSHQLKNPMTAIRGYSDLLTNGFLGQITPQQSQSLETVIYNLDRVNEGILVPNSIFKMYANRLKKQKQDESIYELLSRMCDIFRRTNHRNQIRVKCEISPELNFPTDRLFFEESFRGILKTCMHFMEVNQDCRISGTCSDQVLSLVIHCRMDAMYNISSIDNFELLISNLLEKGHFTEVFTLWKKSVLLWEFIGGNIAGAELKGRNLTVTLHLAA